MSCVGALEQARQRARACRRLRELVGARSASSPVAKLRAVPGRVARAVAELARARRPATMTCGARGARSSARRSTGVAAEARASWSAASAAGRARLSSVTQSSTRDAEHGVGPRERLAVVERARSRRRTSASSTSPTLRLLGLLVAGDRADDVAAQRARRDGEAGQPDVGEALGDPIAAIARRGLTTSTRLFCATRAPMRVDDRLRAARAGQGLARRASCRRRSARSTFSCSASASSSRRSVSGGALVGVDRLDRRRSPPRRPSLAVGLPARASSTGCVEVVRRRRTIAGRDLRERRHDEARAAP